MHTPHTNKIPQDKLEEKFGENAKLLEDKLAQVNWKPIIIIYLYALALLSITLFSLVFSVKLALFIFTLF